VADLHGDLELMTGDRDGSASVWAALQSEAGRLLGTLSAAGQHPALQQGANKDASLLTAELRGLAVSAPAPPAQAEAEAPARPPAPADAAVSAALEQRLFALETLLGSSANTLDMEGVEGRQGGGGGVFPLAEGLARMERRVAALDNAALEKLRTAAGTLRVELEATNREKNKNLGPEHRVVEAVAKLDDLHQQVGHCSSSSRRRRSSSSSSSIYDVL
jgi:hypothetical protein